MPQSFLPAVVEHRVTSGVPAQQQPTGRPMPPDPFPFSDIGNGMRLAAAYSRVLRYCDELGQWFWWDRTRWLKVSQRVVMAIAKQVAEDISRELGLLPPNSPLRDGLLKHAKRSQSRAAVTNMIEMAKSEPAMLALLEQFDTHDYLLNCLNDTLDLRTGELRRQQPEDFITQLAPWPYEPEAPCPTWMAFLHKVTGGNRSLMYFLQRCVGYALTGSTAEQCLFILLGDGCNGKSVFLEIIAKLLGDYARHADSSTFQKMAKGTIRNDVMRLHLARFVSTVELEQGCYLAESQLKRLTGGDTVVARYLYREHVEFLPRFKIFIAANHLPRIRGNDDGIWRRMVVLPFSVKITEAERDREIVDKLAEEMPGILAWGVRGALAWQHAGLASPSIVTDAVNAYRAEMDVPGRFMADCCVTDPEARWKTGDVHSTFLAWCRDAGEEPLGTREFTQSMKRRGFTSRKSTGGRYFLFGLRLKTEGDGATDGEADA